MSASQLRVARLVAAAAMLLAVTACAQREPEALGTVPGLRRLTEEQFANVIVDVFGADLSPEAGRRFDPLTRSGGLASFSTRTVRITPTGFEKIYNMARSVASRVVDETHRRTLVPCEPARASMADDACAGAALRHYARLLYRRDVAPAEVEPFVRIAHQGSVASSDFYSGLALALSSVLTAPEFLFIVETVEPDPDAPGSQRLTGYAKASRLSFFLWNSAPDDRLLAAAAAGELHTPKSLAAQVDRLLSSPKLERGVRAFFSDFLDLQKFDTLEKDPLIYPAFNLTAADEAREQILRTVAAMVIEEDGDYRDLFTSRKTFLTRSLARLYRVPAPRTDDGWAEVELPADSNRAGLQTQVGLMALYAHPGRSSPTLRGKAVRELLMCQKIPDPPGNVDFSAFNDPNSPHRTARERLTVHATQDSCAGCHKLTDPIGLAFENFDGAGQYRTSEDDAPIDASGSLGGVVFNDAVGLAQALRDDAATTNCLVSRLYGYGLARPVVRGDAETINYLDADFRRQDYRVVPLLRRLSTSAAFFAVAKSSTRKRVVTNSESRGTSMATIPSTGAQR